MDAGTTRKPAGRAPLNQFRCTKCRYGASRPIAPERCPMCGGTVWEHEPWSPFGHATAIPQAYERPQAETDPSTIRTLRFDALVDYCTQLYTRVEQLETALESRIVIEQAKGVLAERMKLPIAEAFELLRFAARSERTKLHQLAKQVVDNCATPQAIIRATSREQRWRARSLLELDEAIRERATDVKAAQQRQAVRQAPNRRSPRA